MIRDLFACRQFCPATQQQSEVVFSITRQRSELSLHKEYHSLEDVEWEEDMSYTRIQKSRYAQIVAQLHRNHQLFTDKEFPPNEGSLGPPPSRSKKIVWRRVRQFLTHPVFFDESDNAQMPIGNSNDCYLLPTITALFEGGPRNLQRLFASTEVSPHGIYMVRVNFMGAPQEIIVDDYFPVYQETNKLVFAKPRQGNEIWQMIVEKVWAKLCGSYFNIQSGLPHEVMTTFSHAPCFCLNLNNEDERFVWLQLQDACQAKFPAVASSRKDVPIDCGIRPLQTYSIIGSYELQASGQLIGRAIKMLCPTETEVFEGEYHPKNLRFWQQISTPAKQAMGYYQAAEEISFYVSLTEFFRYFDSVNLCHLRPNYNYNFERGNSPTGSAYYEVELEEDGEVYFTLHQKQLKASSNMSIYGRMTVLVVRMTGDDYQYVTSKM